MAEAQTDWRRAEWQYNANVWATRILIVLIIMQAPEVMWALKYHFPWWDDLMEAITVPLTAMCWFIKNKTQMYRWDT